MGAPLKIVRPETPAPIGADTPRQGPRLGTLILRFTALLVIVVALMVLAWSQ